MLGDHTKRNDVVQIAVFMVDRIYYGSKAVMTLKERDAMCYVLSIIEKMDSLSDTSNTKTDLNGMISARIWYIIYVIFICLLFFKF